MRWHRSGRIQAMTTSKLLIKKNLHGRSLWIQKFSALQSHHKLLLVRAWFLLAWYRGALAVFSIRRLCSSFHHSAGFAAAMPSPLASQNEAREMGRLVAAASRVTPWKSQCLVQVLAVQHLLAARGISGTLYLGVRLYKPDSRPNQLPIFASGFSAHAWLSCGDTVVSGETGCGDFSVMSSFTWQHAQIDSTGKNH